MNIAFIATGFIAKNHADQLIKMSDVNIVGAVDINEEAGKVFAEKYHTEYYKTVEELFENKEVNAVVICLPTNLHKEYVIKCARMGVHILCEKPFTFKTEDCREMIYECQKAGVRFMIAHVIRFWPEYIKIREIINSNIIGDIELVHLTRMSAFPKWSKFYDTPSMSGGGIYDQHLHDVDYACWLFGAPEKVYSIGYKNYNGAWHNAVSNITFKNGISACITVGEQMSDNYPFTMNFRCVGTKGTIEFCYKESELLRAEPDTSLMLYLDGESKPQKVETEGGNGYYNEDRYFIDRVNDGKPFEIVPIEESARSIGVIEAVVKSLESGEIIHFR